MPGSHVHFCIPTLLNPKEPNSLKAMLYFIFFKFIWKQNLTLFEINCWEGGYNSCNLAYCK